MQCSLADSTASGVGLVTVTETSHNTHNGALPQQTIKHGIAYLACLTFATDKWPDVSDTRLRHIGLMLHCRCRCNLSFAKINVRIWRSCRASRSFNLLCCMLSTRAQSLRSEGAVAGAWIDDDGDKHITSPVAWESDRQ